MMSFLEDVKVISAVSNLSVVPVGKLDFPAIGA
jgi:hypothetical protein